jgi:hypothetical protein
MMGVDEESGLLRDVSQGLFYTRIFFGLGVGEGQRYCSLVRHGMGALDMVLGQHQLYYVKNTVRTTREQRDQTPIERPWVGNLKRWQSKNKTNIRPLLCMFFVDADSTMQDDASYNPTEVKPHPFPLTLPNHSNPFPSFFSLPFHSQIT